MQRKNYRSHTSPKNSSRRRVWHRAPATKAKSKRFARSRTFINISQEMKHGRGPRK